MGSSSISRGHWGAHSLGSWHVIAPPPHPGRQGTPWLFHKVLLPGGASTLNECLLPQIKESKCPPQRFASWWTSCKPEIWGKHPPEGTVSHEAECSHRRVENGGGSWPSSRGGALPSPATLGLPAREPCAARACCSVPGCFQASASRAKPAWGSQRQHRPLKAATQINTSLLSLDSRQATPE